MEAIERYVQQYIFRDRLFRWRNFSFHFLSLTRRAIVTSLSRKKRALNLVHVRFFVITCRGRDAIAFQFSQLITTMSNRMLLWCSSALVSNLKKFNYVCRTERFRAKKLWLITWKQICQSLKPFMAGKWNVSASNWFMNNCHASLRLHLFIDTLARRSFAAGYEKSIRQTCFWFVAL